MLWSVARETEYWRSTHPWLDQTFAPGYMKARGRARSGQNMGGKSPRLGQVERVTTLNILSWQTWQRVGEGGLFILLSFQVHSARQHDQALVRCPALCRRA